MYSQTHEREWLAPKEVAYRLGVHVASIYRAVESGRLPSLRLSNTGAIRIPASALERAATRQEGEEA
jgi:excisionase family DNA binding protein